MYTSLTYILWLSFCNLYQIFDFMLQNIVLLLSSVLLLHHSLQYFEYLNFVLLLGLGQCGRSWCPGETPEGASHSVNSVQGRNRAGTAAPREGPAVHEEPRGKRQQWGGLGLAQGVPRGGIPMSDGGIPMSDGGNSHVRRGESPYLIDWPHARSHNLWCHAGYRMCS